MGSLVLKYTSYAMLDHQAANVMQPVIFVFILTHKDNDKFDDRHVDRRSKNQPLVLKSLVV
jgi:hypothetical protein